MDFTYVTQFFAKGTLSAAIGTNLLATAILAIIILLIPNDSETPNKDRSELAALGGGVLAILGLLQGGFGIVLLAILLLWTILENIR